MKSENKFYVFREKSINLLTGYTYNTTTGEITSGSGVVLLKRIIGANVKKLKAFFDNIQYQSTLCLQWNENDEYIGFNQASVNNSKEVEFEIFENTTSAAILFSGVSEYTNLNVDVLTGFEVNPHYKKLEKKSKKENNQMFFRESLDGKVSLFGVGYSLIKSTSIEENLYFYVYRNSNVLISASFNKSDCIFDHFKKSVELKLAYNDKYTNVLDAYENTYDLIKLAPAITQIELTKRTVLQIYIQGEQVVSNYAGGSYWETDVDEQIDNETQLSVRYHFAKGPKFIEVDLQGFNYDINAAYTGLLNSNIWNATSSVTVYEGGEEHKYRVQSSIVFRKIANANDLFTGGSARDVKMMSTGVEGDAIYISGNLLYRYDTYKIEIWTGLNGTGAKIYESDYSYGKDTDFIISAGTGLYPMTKVNQSGPTRVPTPETFNLGENVIEYQVWGRILCDADTFVATDSQTYDTFDLPRDDFATPRRNYRKCFGVTGFDNPNSVVRILQSSGTSESPTAYGINDFGEYFVPPIGIFNQHCYPLARSSWANVSLWVVLGDINGIDSFEAYCAKFYKEYTLKDTYHIGDVIKVLLSQIDSSLKHEKTSEYSSFLYGHSGGTASLLGNCDIYISQKTNVLKGEYDQAAQKAEIKFEQLMNMLRDCFRCFWFIDDQNRFRIEHVSYFMKGLSYDSPTVQLDLTSKKDKFNRKPVLFCQREIEYDKSDLISRYEFKYMDDVTKAMGGDLYIDVNNKYIKKDKTEEINIDGFTADIDYMLFLPDDFSDDGFALLLAANKKVPIVKQVIVDEKQFGNYIQAYTQNFYASFNQLIWHYMEDISGNNITYNNLISSSLRPGHVKRCVKHSIEFPSGQFDINLYSLIKTNFGNGYINEVSSNIDTDLTEVELRYEPS